MRMNRTADVSRKIHNGHIEKFDGPVRDLFRFVFSLFIGHFLSN